MKNNIFNKTQKGVASLYVVIFATILFGVITLSFVRLIIAESQRSSKDDLSQSAYDSALAGVEDAKRAIKQYYDGGAVNDRIFDPTCNKGINAILGIGDANGGEVTLGSSSVNGIDMNQAYTCVLISKQTDDYRSTMSSENRTRIIPLGVNTDSLNRVREVEFSWFTTVNDVNYQGLNYPGFTNAASSPIPPVVQLTLVSMGGESYNPGSQSADGNFDELSGYNSTMILYPEQKSTCESVAAAGGADVCVNTVNADENADASRTHLPYRISCANANDTTTEFACTVKIQVSRFAAKDTAFLVAALPYADTITAFAARLKTDSGGTSSDIVSFDGAQISIDSTGRANDMVRRVETRVDVTDTYFPIPQYALDIGGGGDESISKRRWITANCWTERGKCDNNGKLTDEELDDGKDTLSEDSDSLSDIGGEVLDPEEIKHLFESWFTDHR